MGILSKTIDASRVAEIEYPDIPGFILKIAYISTEDMSKMIDRNTKIVFSKLTRQKEKEVDNDSFLREYAEKVIVGWKGLRFKHLHNFYPAKIEGFNPEDEIEYDPEDALILLKESTDFNTFLTAITNDVTQFTNDEKKSQIKK